MSSYWIWWIAAAVLIAAERTGRKARAMEIDPSYADVAVRRWQAYTGKRAILESCGETFETIEEQRATKPDSIEHVG